jgi:hypothetical protein
MGVSHHCHRDSLDTQHDATCPGFDGNDPISPGARCEESAAKHVTKLHRAAILAGLFIFWIAYSLENLLRVVYQVCTTITPSSRG